VQSIILRGAMKTDSNYEWQRLAANYMQLASISLGAWLGSVRHEKRLAHLARERVFP
jgi:hypothetical protein